MIVDRLLELEVLDDGERVSHTFHRVIPFVADIPSATGPPDKALALKFEPRLPALPEGAVLRCTLQDQTFETTADAWRI